MAIKPVTVSQLNGYIKRVLQSDPLLGNVSVIGEISNLKFHSSGHVYFTLKDASSRINCFLAAENLKHIRYELSDGMEITAAGFIYLYERGGSYSINIRDIQVQGAGNLAAAFERLKEKLSKEGLFDDAYKKPLPVFPRKVAVITSETGAAVRDVVKIIKNRNNIVNVLIYPVLVQGPGAAQEIADALDAVNELFPDTDVIITGRGGGSMEELWAFNEELVARSIFRSVIPVISAVGHEIDFTIADFVADRRAETPTAAAQMAVPDVRELRGNMEALEELVFQNIRQVLHYKEMAVQSSNIGALHSTLENRIALNHIQIQLLNRENAANLEKKWTACDAAVRGLKESLTALNPLSIMARGYGAVLDGEGKLCGSAAGFCKEDDLTVVFSDGRVDCLVVGTRKE